MSLDTNRLQKLKAIGGGNFKAQCPACFEMGTDKAGNHLHIFPDGKFGCAVYQGDHLHRQRIYVLCGNPEKAKNIPIRHIPREQTYVNCSALLEEWSMFTDLEGIEQLANKLGVSSLALRFLGVVWSGEHWAFPMKDKFGDVCGIQLRYSNGFKQTLRNCRVGYFIPACAAQRTAFVCEGASDTASALTLGLYAVGRYNCAQSGYDLGQYLRRVGVRDVVVIADNDNPGIMGAEKLVKELNMHCCIYTPPAKDLRLAMSCGITKAVIESSVNSLVWRNA